MAVLVKINESQFRKLFLNEDMHYPKFLDELKSKIALRVFMHIDRMFEKKIFSDDYVFPLNCDYADSITVHVRINKEAEKPKASYFNANDKLVDGKIQGAELFVETGVGRKKLDFNTLLFIIAHEITHLYDDWVSIKNGNGCICKKQNNIETSQFVEYGVLSNRDLFKDVAFLAYMNLKTEKQAFLSQTVQELEALDCDLYNYKDVIKRTATYKNIKESLDGLINGLSTCDDSDLEELNYLLSYKTNIKIPKQNISDFNADTYRSKLTKWAEMVYKNTLKAYGSVVQYYLDTLKEKLPPTSMYVRD